MVEIKEKQTEKVETPEPKAQDAEAPDLIAKAAEAAERLEKANKVLETNLARLENLQIKNLLGGKADAGSPQKEETPTEYAKKVMANDIEAKNP